jgi:hypothetical protein
MRPRTPTLPPTEPAMWRKLLARTHPDTGGSHELFIWTNALRETVEESVTSLRYEPPRYEPTSDTTDRVPFTPGMDFDLLTLTALELDTSQRVYRNSGTCPSRPGERQGGAS